MKNEKDADAETAEKESPDPPREQTPFERFEEFAKRIISVPKSEIDERERAYQEQKEKGLRKALP